MAENTKIQWATHTFNPWRGCTKIAAGCANCYADAQSKRNPGTLGIWGPNGTRVVASEAMWREPVRWNYHAEKAELSGASTDSPRVFCASLADVFEGWEGQVSNSRGEKLYMSHGEPAKLWHIRQRLMGLWRATPYLTWLVLTKRPENILTMLTGRHHNIWLGTSIANQEDADRNIPELLKCRDWAAKLFVSVEPLIGPVDLSVPWDGEQTLPTLQADWVIVGGESGPHARPCNVDWIRSIVRQCQAAGVPCFVKQTGAVVLDGNPGSPCSWPGLTEFRQANEWCRVLIRDPKGGDMAEWPEDIRVREVP